MIFDFSDDFKAKKADISSNAIDEKPSRKRRGYDGREDRSPLKTLKLNSNSILPNTGTASSINNENYIVGYEPPSKAPLKDLRPQWEADNETVQQSLSGSDLALWVSNELMALGLEALPATSDPSVLRVLQALISERSRYQRQSADLSSENFRLRSDLTIKESEKEKDSMLMSGLHQDIKNLNNKLGSMLDEHRVAKSHWLNEKNELLGRCLQIQALQTQCQGTLRKKEMEFHRLHQQLEKLVTKDTSKGTVKCVVISKPLQRNLSQAPKVTLKDAELAAKNDALLALEEENVVMRAQLANIQGAHQQELRELKDKILQTEDKYSAVLASWAEEKKCMLEQFETLKTASHQAAEDRVAQELREKIAVENQKAFQSLRAAEQTIREQDKLIRKALFDKLPAYAVVVRHEEEDAVSPRASTRVLRSASKKKQASKPERKSKGGQESVPLLIFSPLKKSKPLSTDRMLEDFLPPASPETMAVLKSCGWTDLPSLSAM